MVSVGAYCRHQDWMDANGSSLHDARPIHLRSSVVEILSPSTARRDRTVKRELYARMGVPHYWLIDPERRILEAYELRAGEYELVVRLTGAAEFRPTLFPGLVISLGAIWPKRTARRPRRPS
jgi:hypothetical protein